MTKEEAMYELIYSRAMCEIDPMTGKVGFRNDADRRQAEALEMALEALNQGLILDEIRAKLIQAIQNGTLKIDRGKGMLFRVIDEYREREE